MIIDNQRRRSSILKGNLEENKTDIKNFDAFSIISSEYDFNTKLENYADFDQYSQPVF